MSLYYVSTINLDKYNLTISLPKGSKSIREIQQEILQNPIFCRDEASIETSELKSYLVSGITIYSLDDVNKINGVINFDINGPNINVLGLCAPKPSVGIGSKLINFVIQFSEVNHIKNIKLTCYGDVVQFYLKNGFKIQNQSQIYDSDDSDSEESKTKYNMMYVNDSFGGRKKRSTRKYKNVNSKRYSHRQNTKNKKQKNKTRKFKQ